MGKQKKKENVQIEELNNALFGGMDIQRIDALELSEFSAPIEPSPSSPQIKKPKTYRIRGRLLKSGKGANPVTEVYEWPTHLSTIDLKKLLSRLKKALGCGGTLKERSIEIQGDKINQVQELLAIDGFILIRSGG